VRVYLLDTTPPHLTSPPQGGEERRACKRRQAREGNTGIWRGKLIERLLHILRMIKFEHTIFALPLAYVGAIMGAKGWPSLHDALFILLAMIGARSSAMTFNRLVDLPFDRLNPRTKDRELVRGTLNRSAATLFLVCSVALFFLSAWALNPLCLYLSPIALAIILGYSYTKRFTWLCHIFLGLSLALAPVGGYVAVTENISLPAVLFAVGVLFWVAGFDVIYACQDVGFDRKMGLQSMPAKMGARKALQLSSFFHFLSALFFIIAGWMARMPWPYFASTAAVAVLLTIEHRIVSGGKLEKIDLAFFTVNSYVSVTLLAGVALSVPLIP